jgi:hypothetical protein
MNFIQNKGKYLQHALENGIDTDMESKYGFKKALEDMVATEAEEKEVKKAGKLALMNVKSFGGSQEEAMKENKRPEKLKGEKIKTERGRI